MIHVDVFYDYQANQMRAVLDTNYGVPKLVPLPAGYAFDSRSNYSVLSGKAYSLQYAWNPGGVFAPPPGAAVWIECLNASPELEVYDGPGNKTETPPRPYTPILGTSGSAKIWQWYGRMAHNACAVLNPQTNRLFAEYRVYFGDAQTGSREAYTQYNDATVSLTWTVDPVLVVKPSRGGGLDTNSPMVHVDLFYDYQANQMRATLDTSAATPKLVPLPAGYTFDSRSNYSVLSGKYYNFQYAWNPGGVFTPPPGAAVWIEALSTTPNLETYDGPGNKMENPPRTYAPIFGTKGASAKWKWYGRMAHNSYALLAPTNSVVTAEYRVYFGDAETGSREAFASYADAVVQLKWLVDLAEPPTFQFGAVDQTNGAPLRFINAADWTTNSLAVVNLHYTNAGHCASQYSCALPLLAVPATAQNGGPAPSHAALGSCVELECVSLTGPEGGRVAFWQPGETQPLFQLAVGESGSAHRVCLSQNPGGPEADPYGQLSGRHFAASSPGLYCLGLRLVDSSTNGAAGGPIHAPSEIYYVYLQAGYRVHALTRSGSKLTAQFGGEPGKTFYLEHSAALDPWAAWKTVAGPLSGAARLQTLSDPGASSEAGFFRLRVTTP
jgi:hypothetical protein